MSKKKNEGHTWKYTQTGGLIQVNISTIDDVLNLDKLDPKQWTALACPTKGLEFSEETLNLLDTDKNGRVRVPEILTAVEFIKKYFKDPSVIMSEGDSIPLEALSDTPFDCGHSPIASAKQILSILGKPDATEISLEDVSINEKLFSPGVINGDGVVTAECITEESTAEVVKKIIEITGGTDDISGVKGVNRDQINQFFASIRALKEWKEAAVQNDPKIFFLKEATDTAAAAYMKVRDKINEYYLRCSLINYDSASQDILKKQTDAMYLDENGNLQSIEKLSELPIALPAADKPLPLDNTINPAWLKDMEAFKENVILPLGNKELPHLSETNWRKIEAAFEPYVTWYNAMPSSEVSSIGLEKITEILANDEESKVLEYMDKEDQLPPVGVATVDLRKMLILRRDFVKLLNNFVCFSNFYRLDDPAIFQCGTLYVDGRSCDLCFRVLDIAKHGIMASLSQCFLVYCDCTRAGSADKIQIAALISNGNTDNLIVGRNGVFYDRNGNDWDATIVKIISNPVSIRQAFWAPYKKLAKFIQEKVAQRTAAAEANVTTKMSGIANNPSSLAGSIPKKSDIGVGTIAAISVAFTGIASVVGGVVAALLGLKAWLPLGILGILLAISLPSMIIAWSKLRQRNIAPILDASGWAINGNIKITIPLGSNLTRLPYKPIIKTKDPYADKKSPAKKIIIWIIIIALIIGLIVLEEYFFGYLGSYFHIFKEWCAGLVNKQ
ncbi:MAG: hypothetical protein MJ162_07815 [Treponema sp.]|nr:hypothetical protein [Treponema sp.]